MKKSILKQVITLFVVITIVFPSFSFADSLKKTFELDSVDWQVLNSNCDSWYDYATDNNFSLPGWESVSRSTRLYGYNSANKSCSGDLTINNDQLGMYAIFSYDQIKKTWIKLAASSKNLNIKVTEKPITFVLAQATISPDKKVFGEFSVKNNLFVNSDVANTPTTTFNIIGKFSVGTTTATTTISWNNAFKNYYQLAVIEKDQFKILTSKVENKKDLASVDLAKQISPITVFVVQVKKTDLGLATWYAYKNCDCAASRDYPKGTKLKVTNLYPGNNHGKSVIVKVNDYGPMERTGNLIDLDKSAYKKIANLGSGVVPVSVEVVK